MLKKLPRQQNLKLASREADYQAPGEAHTTDQGILQTQTFGHPDVYTFRHICDSLQQQAHAPRRDLP